MSAAENKAVFLGYASQDAEAVLRIAEALRASGVEVWFDKVELVGGDAKIRGQIASWALFVPVISAATQARRQGYFRIEWKLAGRRTHAMATAKAFLLPVVKLLRVPSGLTVPMLKGDPAWDNVREDAAFKALLADPKNNEPLL